MEPCVTAIRNQVNKTFSTYLDFLRGFAALLVFLHHAVNEQIIGNSFALLGAFGEDAVMIFFVLSGYVISYVATEREACPRDYIVSRFARLYSVVVPILVLTIVFDYMGRQADFSLYEGRSNDSFPWIRALVSLSFTNQFWFIDIHYFSNSPYWSISYEFWYYVLFGIAIFLQGWRRLGMLCIVAVLVGPLILLLMPVWCLGVALQYCKGQYCSVSSRVAWSLFGGSLVAYITYRYFSIGPQLVAISDSWLSSYLDPMQLHKARFFLHDYIIGALTALHLMGANALAERDLLQLDQVENPIRVIASYSFSMYLVHVPLMLCLMALSPWPSGDIRRSVLVIAGSLIVVWLIGSVTEKKKHLWKKMFFLVWDVALKRA